LIIKVKVRKKAKVKVNFFKPLKQRKSVKSQVRKVKSVFLQRIIRVRPRTNKSKKRNAMVRNKRNLIFIKGLSSVYTNVLNTFKNSEGYKANKSQHFSLNFTSGKIDLFSSADANFSLISNLFMVSLFFHEYLNLKKRLLKKINHYIADTTIISNYLGDKSYNLTFTSTFFNQSNLFKRYRNGPIKSTLVTLKTNYSDQALIHLVN
jgi:hypothetical protein